jgi:3-deoxy-manno-octulosonate cytidylyltransferase (CMP-KDO synthetase)
VRILVVIPARYHSTRFPGKPLVHLCGKPMIQHVYEQSCAARHVHEVWVATDDHRIYEAVRAFGGKVLLTSPDHKSGTERMAEAAQKISASILINVQGDEPLIRPEAIDLLAEAMIRTPSCKVATLKRRISQEQDIYNPNCVKVVTDSRGSALYFSRSPIPFCRDGYSLAFSYYQHIGIYAYRKNFLLKISSLPPSPLEQSEVLEQLRILENGYSMKVLETDYESYGIDTPEDIPRVESILRGKMKPGSSN